MANRFKVSEIFYSLQGEGLYLGTPSVFLRLFGCNFRCMGFGMPRGELSSESLQVDPTKYKNYKDLPLVHTGCDSYASWDSRFQHLSESLSVEEVADRIFELLPDHKLDANKHLIVTGGEPLLQGWQWLLGDLIIEIARRNSKFPITFETNGTQILSDRLAMILYDFGRPVTFSISSKLPSSGEAWERAIKPQMVRSYFAVNNFENDSNYYFKWVVSCPEDWDDIQRAIDTYRKGGIDVGCRVPVYLMPAGGTTKGYDENKKWVAELAMKNGLRYSPRLQVELWKNQWGT